MDPRLWLSLLPSLTAIVLAILTGQVIPSLLAGLWVGSFIMAPGLLPSVSKTVSYIVGMLSDPGNLDVLLFLYVFSGLVSMIQVAGGVKGFTQLMDRWVNSKRGTLLAAWGLAPITFLDCGFRVVAAGAIIKPLAEKFGVARERLAYTLNNSSSPLISLIPVATTFVGYMLSVIASGLKVAGVDESPFLVLLQSIPFNFFSLTSIAIALLSIFSPWQFARMRAADRAAAKGQMGTASGNAMHHGGHGGSDGHEHAAESGHKPMGMEHDHEMDVETKLPARAYNLLVPIGALIPLSFFMVWWDGRTKASTLLQIFAKANASRALFLALFLTTVLTAVLYRLQGLRLQELTGRFIKGGNKLMVTIVILIMAWPIATVSKDLGLPELITSTIGASLPAGLVPLVVFLATAAVTYFIGSSWGAWALMMPLAIPLAVASGASIPMAAAAVFAGGSFGDVTSPLSGMTAMASGIAEAEHMDYIRAITPYNLTAAALAAGLFLLVPLVL